MVLVGVPTYQSQQVAFLCYLASVPLFFITVLTGRLRFERSYWWMISLVIACVFSSFISSSTFFIQPLESWGPGFFYISPLLGFMLLHMLGVPAKDVVNGLILAAVITATVSVVDQVINIPALDVYLRASTFSSERRIVIGKTEQVFATAVILSRVLYAKRNRQISAICLAVIFYSLTAIAESRLAVAAAILGSTAFVTVFYDGKNRHSVLVGIGIMLVVVSMTLLAPYIANAEVLRELSSDGSARYRELETIYFRSLFEATNGFGFGFMAYNERLGNILSFAMFRGGSMFGAEGYPVGVADIGLWGALYQYGYLGFGLTLGLTGYVGWSLWSTAGREAYARRKEIAAIFCAFSAFLVSPLPMNYFTLDWTVTIGGILFYLAVRAAWEARAEQASLLNEEHEKISKVARVAAF